MCEAFQLLSASSLWASTRPKFIFKVWEVNEPVQANKAITKIGNDVLKFFTY